MSMQNWSRYDCELPIEFPAPIGETDAPEQAPGRWTKTKPIIKDVAIMVLAGLMLSVIILTGMYVLALLNNEPVSPISAWIAGIAVVVYRLMRGKLNE